MILDIAREQVLERGVGLDEAQTLEVLRLPDERVDDALELAHEVRMRHCGPEVEIEGIVSIKTGGCPEDCHFCSQSGRFETPVRAVRLDIPGLVEAARETAATGATPQHSSTTTAPARTRSRARRANSSVRGRGTKRPGATASRWSRKSTHPTTWASGSPATRRVISSARSRPSARRIAASSSAQTQPAARSAATTSSIDPESGTVHECSFSSSRACVPPSIPRRSSRRPRR